jgi:FtsP/CotA-like multicopper oxidase with cupredoxin domain
MDSTTEQVVLGLAGMIILEDPTNDQLRDQLPHDYGKNDFPIVLQEKAFVYDTLNNKVSAKNIFLGKNGNGKVGQGPLTLVNGVLNGYLNVPKQMVRLRLLNGSPVRVLYIGFSSTLGDTSTLNLIPAYLIATDGGYTSSPHSMKKIMIAPGERMEVLLDFTNMPNNSQLFMNNLGVQLPGDIIGGSSDPNKGFMMFRVVDTIKPQDSITAKPSTLLSYSVDTSGIFKKRVKNLTNVTGTPGNGQGGPWTIDSTGFEMETANDTILVDSKEMWTINNKTGVSHPFHIHKVQFQVVNYYGKIGADSDSAYYSSIDTITPGVRRLPSFLMGYKDDVLIRSGASLTFVTTFSNYGDTSIDPMMNGFMYHCHILTHEDDEMMHQFVVVNNSAYHGWPQSVKKIGTLKANLFPNPAGTVLNVNGNLQGLTNVKITDVLGRTLREMQISLVNNQTSFDVADLPRGIVFVELTSGNERLVQKIFLK